MRFRESCAIAFVSILLTAASQQPHMTASAIDTPPTVIVHDHGRSITIKAGADLDALVALCEQALTSVEPGKMLKLLVTPERIDKIKATSRSVEIIYPSVHAFTLTKANRVLRADTLLIALPATSHPRSQGPVTVFYGLALTGGGYRSGPYANLGDYDQRIQALLRRTGAIAAAD